MTKNKRRVIKQTIWAAVLCLVMGMGIVSFADDKGTVIPASAKIRASADASSEQVGSVAQGGSVDITGKTTGADGKVWYQVYVDANTKGYIRSDLIKAAGTGTISDITSTTTSTTTTTTDQSTTTATATDTRKCMVTTNAKIRKGASTNHDIVATVNKGTTLTVTGEANGSDGKVWYQVSFTYNGSDVTGFIRSDLVTFDGVADDGSVTSEITGEAGAVEGEEQQADDTQDSDSSDSSSSSQGIVLMNVDETPYILPGFSAVSLSWNDESINAYSNGGFYLFYARMSDGDEGWYIFDSEKGEYQRYVYTASESATIPKSSDGVGIIPVIVLIVIIIILAAIIGLLIIRLREASYSYEYEDDDQDDDSDDLKFEEIQPRRQAVQSQAGGQMRRQQPQGQQSQGQTNGQVRRQQPQGQQSQGQVNGQVRRQQPQGQQSQGQINGQVRRQQPQGQQSQGQTNGNGQVRRQQPQSSQSIQNQRQQQRQDGFRAKTIIENNDDDMDFIDI